MKVLGAKKLIIIGVLFITLTFFAASLVITNIVININNRVKKNAKVDAAYLTISNLAELQAFAGNLNSGNYDGEYMRVYVTNDIDCQGKTIAIGNAENPFNGYFDGGYNTISNFKISYINDYDPTSGYNTDVGGFFRYATGSIIYGLRLYNFSDSGSSVRYRLSNVGGLIGASTDCHIYSCIIDTFTSSGVNGLVESTSGIVASGTAFIYDCIVKNVTSSNDFYAFGPGAWSNASKTRSELNNAVCHDSPNLKGMFYDNNVSHAFAGCYISNTGDDFSGLSDVGKTSETTWYYCSDYNSWPMLTNYMDWKTVTFNAVNGTVDKTSIDIPSDATNTYSSSTSKISVYGQFITGTGNSGFTQCAGWTCNSVTSYTVTFTKHYYYLQFNKISNISPLCSTFETGTTIKIFSGDKVEVSCSHNNKDYTLIEYKIGEHTVRYQAEKKHDIGSYGNIWLQVAGPMMAIPIENISSYYNYMINGATYSITPTVVLKSYNVTFK